SAEARLRPFLDSGRKVALPSRPTGNYRRATRVTRSRTCSSRDTAEKPHRAVAPELPRGTKCETGTNTQTLSSSAGARSWALTRSSWLRAPALKPVAHLRIGKCGPQLAWTDAPWSRVT